MVFQKRNHLLIRMVSQAEDYFSLTMYRRLMHHFLGVIRIKFLMISRFLVKIQFRRAIILINSNCLARKLMRSPPVFFNKKILLSSFYLAHQKHKVWATCFRKQQIEWKKIIYLAPTNLKIKKWNPPKHHKNCLVLPSRAHRVIFFSLLPHYPLSRCLTQLKTTNRSQIFSNNRSLNQVSLFKYKNYSQPQNRLDYRLRRSI